MVSVSWITEKMVSRQRGERESLTVAVKGKAKARLRKQEKERRNA